MKKIIPVALLLSVFMGLAVSSMLWKSGTCDEIAHHIPAGYSYLKKWDFRLNPSNPPLPRYILAFPLAFLDLKAPFDDISWRQADSPAFARLFYEYNREKIKTVIFLSRLPMVLVGVLGGLLVYFMAARFYGGKSGLFALFLYCFSPNILAHARLATTDITAACFILLSVYTFSRFLRLPNPGHLLSCGLALGLAQLSKYSALLLYPVFLVLVLIELIAGHRASRRLLTGVFLVFAISVITIWAGYGFEVKPFLKDVQEPGQKLEFAQNLGARLIPCWNKELSDKTEVFLKDIPLPLTTYTTGLLGVIRHSHQGHLTYFMGRWSDYGSRLYYAAAFLIKTPISIILFFMTAVFISLRGHLKKDEAHLLVPIAVFFLTASLNKLQLGLRYILPVYPLCFVFSSKIVNLIRHRWQGAAVAVLCVWLICANIFIWPDYLSYFNEFIGGPGNGWRYLRDSNIDWGQDLPALSAYMKKNNIEEVVIEYFGQDEPSAYGIKWRGLTEKETDFPGKNVYAISIQCLEGARWSRDYRPTARAGGSILIYDFREKA